jgi:hypothetical protein
MEIIAVATYIYDDLGLMASTNALQYLELNPT